MQFAITVNKAMPLNYVTKLLSMQDMGHSDISGTAPKVLGHLAALPVYVAIGQNINHR